MIQHNLALARALTISFVDGENRNPIAVANVAALDLLWSFDDRHAGPLPGDSVDEISTSLRAVLSLCDIPAFSLMPGRWNMPTLQQRARICLHARVCLALLDTCASASPETFEIVADYLAQHPASTLADSDAACSVGNLSEVLEDMTISGYGISSEWCMRDVPGVTSPRVRNVKTYTLTHRPTVQMCQPTGCSHASETAKS